MHNWISIALPVNLGECLTYNDYANCTIVQDYI